jgi:chromosome partitioning protein
MAKRISVINFKGGVGKTTLAVELAAGLARYHKPARVLAIDMDHQSSLSILCLGGSGWDSVVKTGKVIDRLFESFASGNVSPPGNDIRYQTQFKPAHYSNLHVVPATLRLDDIEISLTSAQEGDPIKSEWNKRTLICKWLEDSGVDAQYDYIIFDCPPATKIVSQNAIAASHGYIIPVVPEAVMERGAPHLRNMIKTGIDDRLAALEKFGDKRGLFVPDTQLVGVVVTRIKSASGASGYTDDHTQHLASLRRRWKTDLIKPYIPEGTGVSQTLSAGVPIFDWPNAQNVGGRGIDRMYKTLVGELKTRIDAL